MSQKRILLHRLPVTSTAEHDADPKPGSTKVLKLELHYELGGISYFTGQSSPRGYYASSGIVTEFTPEPGSGGYASTSFLIGGRDRTFKRLIQEAKSFNAATFKRISETAVAQVQLAAVLRSTLDANPHLSLTPLAATSVAALLGLASAPAPAIAPPPPAAAPRNQRPDTIQAIIDQCGGLGLNGAFVYCGAQHFTHRCPEAEGECRGEASHETEDGTIHYTVGLQCTVNGKRGERWTLTISYEPDDTYKVWLTTSHSSIPGRKGALIEVADDVYADSLKATVERLYDDAIKSRNSGFIPV